MAVTRGMDRREFIVTTLTVGGGFALALAFPPNQVEAAADTAKIPTSRGSRSWEGRDRDQPLARRRTDDTVTIRVAQSEMGQGHSLPGRR